MTATIKRPHTAHSFRRSGSAGPELAWGEETSLQVSLDRCVAKARRRNVFRLLINIFSIALFEFRDILLIFNLSGF